MVANQMRGDSILGEGEVILMAFLIILRLLHEVAESFGRAVYGLDANWEFRAP
jgi:hypothetical protein